MKTNNVSFCGGKIKIAKHVSGETRKVLENADIKTIIGKDYNVKFYHPFVKIGEYDKVRNAADLILRISKKVNLFKSNVVKDTILLGYPELGPFNKELIEGFCKEAVGKLNKMV